MEGWEAGDTEYLVVLLTPNKDTEGCKTILEMQSRKKLLKDTGPEFFLIIDLETWIFLIFSMQSRAFLVDITIQILKVQEYMYRWKQHKHVHARGRGAWASLAHALQCLCDGRACCSPRALQLVILGSEVVRSPSPCCCNS